MSRLVLITGTRKGIGKELRDHFLAGGWDVAGCSRQPVAFEHERYRHFEMDVGNEKDVVDMVGRIGREMGPIHALINNAGVAQMNHLLLTPGSAQRKMFETNFLGTFVFLREVAKVMIRHKSGGRIVNFTTIAAALHLEGEAMYAASKAAVESLTRTAARELAPHRITVNAIGPGPVETDLLRTVPKEKIESLIQRQPLKRLGTFDDIKNVVDFFVSEKSDFVTGQVIYLGGV